MGGFEKDRVSRSRSAICAPADLPVNSKCGRLRPLLGCADREDMRHEIDARFASRNARRDCRI